MDMRMGRIRFAGASILLPLLGSPAIASGPSAAAALDLELPRAALFADEGAGDGSGMAGGDYDRVLRERERARAGGDAGPASNCPPAADGSGRGVTGSFTTGIGHSSRGGNSHWNAADINLCREYVGDAGKVNTMNMRIQVGQYDGPGYFHGGGFDHGYYGPGPGGFPGPGGAWDVAPSRDGSWSEGRRPWR